MRKLKRALVLLLLPAAAWVLVVLTEWLPRPTQPQREGIAAVAHAPANVAGERNAFPLLWLFGYDIPESELEQVTAEDVARFSASERPGAVFREFTSSAQGRYPALPVPPNDDPAMCRNWEPGCLERVRADPQATRARLAEFAGRLERSEWLLRYDHSRYLFERTFDSPIGGFGGVIQLQTTAAAFEYVDGRVDAAFDRLCRHAAAWRRLRARTDTLIDDMVGISVVSNAASLYAEMLAEQPAGFSPPCPETFAPLQDSELDQCGAMRGEYLFWTNRLEPTVYQMLRGELSDSVARAYAALVNTRHLEALAAANIGYYCTGAHRERVRLRSVEPAPSRQSCGALAWAFDPLGCTLSNKSIAAYDSYYERALDFDARLKLLQLAIRLHARAPGDDPQRLLDQRPPGLATPLHDITLDGDRLRVQLLQQKPRSHFELRLRADSRP